jgi:NTE family protein
MADAEDVSAGLRSAVSAAVGDDLGEPVSTRTEDFDSDADLGRSPGMHNAVTYEDTAVVFSGAGARGAYEAGMLSVLLPALELDGHRPKVFVGTSAGAINSVLFASLAHLPAASAAEQALATWRSITKSMVIRPAVSTLPVVGVRYLAGIFGIRGQPSSLLDTTPLLASLKNPDLMDWAQLHDNVLNGDATMAAAVTTEFGTGRTKVFVEGSPTQPDSDDDRAIDYVRTTLIPEHVLASSAIPVAFSPVQLGTHQQNSWHMDGGVRLNAPLKPALTLGAGRLVVISTDAAHYRSGSTSTSQPIPSIQDSVDQVLRGLMGDRMIEDLNSLTRTNVLLAAGGAGAMSRSGRVYRIVPFLFGGPPVSEDIGAVAEQALAECLEGVRALRNLDLSLVRLLLSSGPMTRGDLISYLLFEPEFLDRAIAIGQEHAEAVLRAARKQPNDPALTWNTTSY